MPKLAEHFQTQDLTQLGIVAYHRMGIEWQMVARYVQPCLHRGLNAFEFPIGNHRGLTLPKPTVVYQQQI